MLGSTGSIGKSTIDLLAANRDRYQVLALVANGQAELLAEQARALDATFAVCFDSRAHARLADCLAGSGIRSACGHDAVLEAARMGADWTMAAITGIAGLAPTLAAAEGGRTIALANKEALVSAGDVMLRAVARDRVLRCCRSIPSTTRSSRRSPGATAHGTGQASC